MTTIELCIQHDSWSECIKWLRELFDTYVVAYLYSDFERRHTFVVTLIDDED